MMQTTPSAHCGIHKYQTTINLSRCIRSDRVIEGLVGRENSYN